MVHGVWRILGLQEAGRRRLIGSSESVKCCGDEMPQQLPEQCVAEALFGVGRRICRVELELAKLIVSFVGLECPQSLYWPA